MTGGGSGHGGHTSCRSHWDQRLKFDKVAEKCKLGIRLTGVKINKVLRGRYSNQTTKTKLETPLEERTAEGTMGGHR
jgi:hypothetical protein